MTLAEADPQSWPCAATTCRRELRQTELLAKQPICSPCVGDMRRWLGELPNQLIVLGGSRQRETTGSPARGGTKTPPMPGREDVLNLIGPGAPGDVRDPYGDQHGPLPIITTLGSWARIICEERTVGGRRLAGPQHWTETALATWLEPHLDWSASQAWAGEMRDELFDMIRVVRSATRLRAHTRPVSRPCPSEACESLSLVEQDWNPYIECQACGRLWTQSELNDDATRRLPRSAA